MMTLLKPFRGLRPAPGRAGEVVLATSDKDMFQLVSERVRIAPVSGGGALLGPEDVRRKLGVE